MRNFLHITNSFRYFQYLLLNWQHIFDTKCNRVTVLRLQLLFVVTSIPDLLEQSQGLPN